VIARNRLQSFQIRHALRLLTCWTTLLHVQLTYTIKHCMGLLYCWLLYVYCTTGCANPCLAKHIIMRRSRWNSVGDAWQAPKAVFGEGCPLPSRLVGLGKRLVLLP